MPSDKSFKSLMLLSEVIYTGISRWTNPATPFKRVAGTLGLIGDYTLPSTNMNEVVRNGIYGCNGTDSSWRNLPELSNGILIVFCTGGRILQLYAIAAGAKLFCRHGYKSSSWTFVGWTEIK